MGQVISLPIATSKHYAIIHHKAHTKQPTHEMAFITNDIKQASAKRHNFFDIMKSLGNGHCVLPSNIEVDDDNKINFVSSSLFMIDIDDDNEVTDPPHVLEQFSELASGLFYTFSHGIKGNRYRLVFRLDRAIRDESKLRIIIEMVADLLLKNGIPADPIKNITVPVRGGIQGFILNDNDVKLNTDEWIDKANKEILVRQEQIKNNFSDEMRFTYSFEDLKGAAEAIGYIPSGSGQTEEWKRIVIGIKHHANTGAITQSEGFELYDIICGGEQSSRDWDRLKAGGQATIGTLIHYAKEKGYRFKKSYDYAFKKVDNPIPTETLKVDTYLTSDVASEIIGWRKRILLDSPTGSGKTESFVKAFQSLASDRRHFYIFAAPTRALTQQIAQKYGVIAVTGSQKDLFKTVGKAINNNHRVFVATYDMTSRLAEYVSWGNGRYTLVVDEIHKYVTDYAKQYRHDVINELHEASMNAISFIGLSGTPSDVLSDGFDMLLKIDNRKRDSPCSDFAIYTYNKEKEAFASLVQLVEAWTKKRKLLIYIQSIEEIKKLLQVLRKKGIVTRVVTAAEKKSHTYKGLVENETIDDNVQVVLATSVIADGININNSFNWECIAVCNRKSPMFNIATLKQMSHRFRNAYSRFSILMTEPTLKEDNLFHINAAYQRYERIASRFTELINQEFNGADLHLFRASILEKDYGLQIKDDHVSINPFHLRFKASQEKESYYSTRRNAFVRALEHSLNRKHRHLNISKEIKADRLHETLQAFDEMDEELKQEKEAKKEGIEAAFTRDVYKAFHEDDEETLNEFKKCVTPSHYACLKRLHKIADYETCKDVVQQVKRNTDTHRYFSKVEVLADIAHFHSFNRMTPTKKVFVELKKNDQYVLIADFNESLTSLSKRMKLKVKDVKKAKMMFEYSHKRNKKERFVKAEPITIESVAAEFGLSERQVKDTLRNYVNTQPKNVKIAAEKYYKL